MLYCCSSQFEHLFDVEKYMRWPLNMVYVLTAGRFKYVLFHLRFHSLCLLWKLCWTFQKLKLCSIDPKYCMLHYFVYCHMMRINAESSFNKWSMRLRCIARNECIKWYIDMYILEEVCSKMRCSPWDIQFFTLK